MILLSQIYYSFSPVISKLQESVFSKIRISKKKDSPISTSITPTINPILLKRLSRNLMDKKIKNTKIRVSKYKKQVERDPLANIFVKNIHNNLNEQILNDYFKKFGTIESFKINQAG